MRVARQHFTDFAFSATGKPHRSTVCLVWNGLAEQANFGCLRQRVFRFPVSSPEGRGEGTRTCQCALSAVMPDFWYRTLMPFLRLCIKEFRI